MLKRAVVMCAVSAVALAAATGGHGEQTEGCHIEDHFIPYGQSVPSHEGCMLYKCAAKDPENPNAKTIYVNPCSPVFVEPDVQVRVVEDSDKPYPQCCPRAEKVVTDSSLPKRNEQKEGCHIGDLFIPYGETATSTKGCVQYKCAAKDPQNPIVKTIFTKTCPTFLLFTQPHVRVVEDSDKPYPQCCPRVEDGH